MLIELVKRYRREYDFCVGTLFFFFIFFFPLGCLPSGCVYDVTDDVEAYQKLLHIIVVGWKT